MSDRRTAGRVISANQLATFCGVDLKTIHNWSNRGKIPCWRTPGRHLRFRRLDVVAFLRAYEFALPEALRSARPSVAVVDRDPAGLAATRKALARRFEVVAFDDVVAALLALAAAEPEVVILGDVSPLDPARIVPRLASLDSTRDVRVVTLGCNPPGAAAWAPRGDAGRLREALEQLTGVD